MKLDRKIVNRGILIVTLSLAVLMAACSPTAATSLNQSQKSETLNIRPATGYNELGNAQMQAPHITVVSDSHIDADPKPSEEIQAVAAGPESTPQNPANEASNDISDPTAEPATPAQAEQSDPNPVEEPGPLPPVDPTVGNLAPDFTLTTLDGESVSLSDLRGRPVLLNYWVTWCIPCRDEMPAIESLQSQYSANGLVVLSINGTKQDVLGDVEKYVSELGLTFPVLLDQSEDVYNSYRVLFMPTSFFIDQRGVIQDILLGSTNEEGFRTRVEKLVSGVN